MIRYVSYLYANIIYLCVRNVTRNLLPSSRPRFVRCLKRWIKEWLAPFLTAAKRPAVAGLASFLERRNVHSPQLPTIGTAFRFRPMAPSHRKV
jgi:hypothetical protein